MTKLGVRDVSDRSESTGVIDLQALFQEHLSPLTRFVCSYVKSWEVAEDIVHDVFLQLWLRERNLEPVRDPTAYLYAVARYDALDYLRHQNLEKRHRHVLKPETVLLAEAERELLASERTAALHRAIDSLPGRQREIMLLRLERQVNYHEIAAILGISHKTVDAHIQRAFAHLRKILHRLVE